ncbi:MAG: nucleoside deaminase [Cyanobacteria bacterium J06641_5]
MFPLSSEAYAQHRYWMQQALAIARTAAALGEVPIGAIAIDGAGEKIAAAANRKERDRDPTAHAELLVLRAASRQLGSWHLGDCTLYVTLEPCPMCASAIVHARLGLLVYGADDPKTGAIQTAANFPASPLANHRPAIVAGICGAECRQQLRDWFARQRQGRNRRISGKFD